MSTITEIAKRYQERKNSEKDSVTYTDVRDRYKAYKIKKSYENGTLNDDIDPLIDRINSYRYNYNKYISDYNDRFVKSDSDGEEAADEYFYRAGDDAAQWAKSATDRKAQLEGESSAILSELEFYKPYVSEEWYNEIANYFNGHGDTMGSIVDVATKDNAYWSKWENEDEYKDSWYYSKFNKKYAGIDSLEGWEKAMPDAIDAAINDNDELSDEGAMEIKYIQDRIDYYKARNYDGAAAEAEIKSLEEEKELLDWEFSGPGINSLSNEELLEHYTDLLDKHGIQYQYTGDLYQDLTIACNLIKEYRKNLESKINNKKSIHESKQKTQTYYEYDALRQSEDFGELSKYDASLFGDRTIDWGATMAAAFQDSLRNFVPLLGLVVPEKGLEYDYSGLEYGFVNGDPNAAKWYQEEYYDDNHALGELIRGETEGYNLYTFLEENEREMYNYLYKSQGEAAAHEYLEFLASDLESRKADKRAQWFEDKPIAGTLYSIPAGIDQFASGVEGIFKDEYDPSVTSMTSQKIREDLADDGKILWYDFSMGSWREMKVLGSSGAQVVYDALSSSANMLPSILVSLAVEAALPTVGEGAAVFAGLTAAQIAAGAGAVTLGASAMGNAKQEMLGMGYSVEQATAYGLMVGASEAGLSYLLSGIPGLRGGDGVFSALGQKAISKVDNALARAAITLGGDMLDEGLEEGLQTVLEGWFKEIATGVDFEDPSVDEVLYSSLLGALTAAGFGGGKLAIDGVSKGINTGVSAYNTAQKGKSYVSKGGVEGVGALAAQGLSLNQNTAAYKQAAKVQAKLDKGKSASNYSVGKLLSSMSESQTSTAVQTRLSANIENKTKVRKLSDTITDILYGREVSGKAISAVAANKYALNALNDVLGSKLGKDATVSDVKAAVQSYQEASKGESGANASTNTKQGSAAKISGRGDVQFAAEKNADGGYDVVGTKGSDKAVLGSFKSQKQAQAAAYAMTLRMGAEGLRGLAALAENLPDGVDLGEAALAFNAFYNQGKNGKAFSAAKNMELLSPEQRHYAYNLGIMDKALDGARKKSSGEVLQNNAESGKINNNKESAENEQSIRLRDGSERDRGQNPGGQVSAVESGTRQDQSGRKAQRRPSDAAAASGLDLGEEVDAQSLGLEGGLDSGKVRLIKDGSENESMAEAKKLAEEHGLEAIFFAGGDIHILKVDPETGKEDVVEARGYIEGNRVYIRVDHPRHAPDQIMRHEICHDMIDNGEIDVNEVRERIKARGVDVEYFIDRYSEAYALSGAIMGPDDVWVEIICDSYGDMNEFASVAEFGKMNAGFLSSLKGEVEASRKDARGPPKSSEGRASREFDSKKKPTYLLYNKVGMANIEYIRNELKELYRGVRNGIADGIAIEKGNTVYIVDSGKENGKIDFGVRLRKTISNDALRDEYIRRRNNDSISKGYVSNELSSRLGSGLGYNTERDLRRESGTELSANKEKSADNQRGVSGKDADNRGLDGKASQDLDFFDYLSENAENTDLAESEPVEERELTNREILANALESTVKTEADRRTLRQYKRRAKALDAMEAELGEVNEKIRELSFAPGPRDKVTLTELKKQKAELEKKIHIKDKALTMLEVSEPLKKVLEREKKRAADKAKAEAREALAAQKARAKEALDKQAKRYQESRKKATEGRHKTAMRHKIAGVVSELDKLLRKGTKERNVKIGLQDAVAAALEIFDLNSEKVERYNKAIADLDARIAAATDPIEIEALTALREKKVKNSERLADKLQIMKKAYEDIHNGRDGENYPSYYKAECEAIENRIAEVMEKVGDTPIGEMSLEQLEAVYDMYRMVLTTVRNANKVFKDGKLADLTADAADMMSELQRIKKLAEERLKAGDDIRGFVWNELTPYYAFKRVGSETLMRYYDELVRGQDVYARDIAEAKEFAAETRKKYKANKWNYNQIVTFQDADGRDFRLSLKHMMSIYAYSKREQAFDHMEKGGFFFNNKETFRKKGGVLEFIASNESGYRVNAITFAKIKSVLTAEQIAYVDEMQAYLTQMGEKGNEVTRQMWGIDLFKEKAYFPLKSKEDFIYQANTPAETSSLKNDGMTKETKPHASNPIVLESFDDVWANHVEKMSKYHGFVIPIDNLNKLVNYGTWISGESQVVSSDTQSGQFSKKVLQKQSDGDIIEADADSLRRVENGTERTDEFRELQKRSREMSGEDSSLYHTGIKKIDDEIRGRLSRTFRLELNSAGGKRIYSKWTLLNPKSNHNVTLLEVEGNLFHDIFEISRAYLRNGELVDLHDEYNNATCYLTEDGLSGFAIEGDGNLVSVFNLSNERGFLRTIAPVIKENATMLDCYASEKQDLQQMYSLIFGFKTASIMDYNMEYDHDDIAKNHGMPKVAFMVNTEAEVETREFNKDQYDEAVEYQHSFVEDNNADTNRNFSTNSQMGSHSISTMLEARFGPGVNDYLNTFIKDLNGVKAQRGGVVGGAFDLLTKFKKTSVAASLSVVVQQPTAILRATSEINPKYFVYLSKPEGLNRKWNQIKKYAPIAIIKDIGGFDAGSGKQITEWMNADTQRGTKKVLNKIDDLTMYGAALGDRIGWGAIWQAVIREVQAKQGLTYGAEEFWQACGKRFTDVIVKTQVYDSTLSRSGFMRGKDGLMKMATAFMGEPTLSINMLADTLLQANRGKISKGQVVRTFAAVYTATVAASIIKSFIYALRDDDEDESYAEKYMQALGGTILDDINPLSMLPILRDVVSIFQGWDVERTDMAVVQDLYNAINSLGSEKKTTYRKIEDLAGAVAALVGVPVKNVMRTAREIYNAIDDIFDGIDGGDLGGAFLEGITGEEKGKTQTLYEALVDGDPDRIYAIKKTYKTGESYLTAVRKALRTYDPRIKEAAQAQIDGDISRRNALLRKIVGEGIFDEMTVSKAITAEVNSIKNEEPSPTEPEDDTPWYDRKGK